MKTRRVSNSPIAVFLKILHVIKLFHWNTNIFSQHKSTDDLHSKLSELIDSYMEKYMGLHGRVQINTSIHLKQSTPNEFIRAIHDFRIFLIRLNRSTELDNIRDEMLGEIDQFLYLWTLH
jgi:DNA-binding ferritin-like protein